MTAWNIIRHSLAQVFGNMAGALRVSALLFAAQIGISFVSGIYKFQDQAKTSAAMADGTFPWGPYVISVLLGVICSVWIIVGWHRYVLLEERVDVLPKFDASRILAYVGYTLLIGLCMIPALLVGMILAVCIVVVMQLAGVAPASAFTQHPQILGTVVLVPVLGVMYRLSLLLPASAIGRPMTVSQAWTATKGRMAVFAPLAIITTIASVLLSLPLPYLLPYTAPLLVYSALSGWLQMMIGASVVTTLYGIYVEDRSLVFS